MKYFSALTVCLCVHLLFAVSNAVYRYSRSAECNISVIDLFSIILDKNSSSTFDPRSNTQVRGELFALLTKKLKLDPTEIDRNSTWTAFEAKLYHLHRNHSRERKKGSRARANLENKWRQSTYKGKIFFHTGAFARIFLQNQLEKSEKRARVLTDQNAQLENRLRRIPILENLVRKLKQRLAGSGFRGSSKLHRLGVKNYSPRQRRRHRGSFLREVHRALSVLGVPGHEILSVKFRHDNGQVETVNFTGTDVHGQRDIVTDRDAELVNMMVYLRDRFMISTEAFHELTMVCKSLPRSYTIRRRIEEMNEMFKITPVPGEYVGVQQLLSTTIAERINDEFASGRLEKDVSNIRIKLAGDGTKIGKRCHVVTFGYSIVNDRGDQPPVQLLAITKCPETYDAQKNALAEVIRDIKETTSVFVGSKSYKLVYYLGGDMKFLNAVCGLDACNSTYSCIWCECPASKRHLTDQNWSVNDPVNGRTVEKIIACSQKTSKPQKKNCSRAPLFDFIPLTRVVPDNLHLLLRITDRMFMKLISELRRMDNLGQTVTALTASHTNIKDLKGLLNPSGFTSIFS